MGAINVQSQDRNLLNLLANHRGTGESTSMIPRSVAPALISCLALIGCRPGVEEKAEQGEKRRVAEGGSAQEGEAERQKAAEVAQPVPEKKPPTTDAPPDQLALATGKAIQANLKSIASAADQFSIEHGKRTVAAPDIVGSYLRALPTSLAGEDYNSLFPIEAPVDKLTLGGISGVGVVEWVRPGMAQKRIMNNLRAIASAAERVAIEEQKMTITAADVFGEGKAIEEVPTPVAGEDYRSVFPINVESLRIKVQTANGETVEYPPWRN